VNKLIRVDPYHKQIEEQTVMARIKITDLPKDVKISEDDMQAIFGGSLTLRDFTKTPLRSALIRGIRWHEALRAEDEYERTRCTD